MYFNLLGNLQHVNLEWSIFTDFFLKDPGDVLNCLYQYECSYFISTNYLGYNEEGQVYKAFLIALQEG